MKNWKNLLIKKTTKIKKLLQNFEKNNERKFPLTIMCLTISIGFVIYFLVDFMYVLGSMEKLNPYIAGIGPIGVCFFIGCYLVSAFDEIKK